MTRAPRHQPQTAVTAIAARSCLGSDLAATVEKVAKGCAGEPLDSLSYDHDYAVRSPMGFIADDHRRQPSDERLVALFKSAIAEALSSSGLLSRHHPRDIGLIIGTTTFGYSQTAAFLEAPSADPSLGAKAGDTHQLNAAIGGDALLAELCRSFELSGYSAVIGTACTSAAMAIRLGHSLVSSGKVAACLAGGFDVITPMTVQGFSCLQLLDEQPTRPFAADRGGINLGEGGAIFAIEPVSTSKPAPMGYIYGGASTCDAHDLTSPDPEATEIRRCVDTALARSGISADDIALINTHGTGTALNDAAESRALAAVFGPSFDAALARLQTGHNGPAQQLVVQATKAFTGHLLGGAGAMEAALALAMPIEAKDQTLARLSCSFGFGGSNVCLVLSPSPDQGGRF